MRSIFYCGGASVALAVCIFACSDEVSPSTTPDASTPVEDAAVPGPDGAASPDASRPDDAAVDSAVLETRGPVEIQFGAVVGATPFACGSTFTGVGTSNATAGAADLRFFVHDIKLLRGTTEVPVTLDVRDPWQSAAIGLVDFEDNTGECEFGTPGTNDKLSGTVLGTGFDGISFTIGVPEALNHLDAPTQPNPLPSSGMNWNWTSGYIHFAAQLGSTTMVDGVRVPSFFSHVGSAMCSGNPADGGTPGCALKNRPTVKLTGFDPTKNKVVIDLAKLFATSDLDVNTAQTIPGCMSSPTDPECAPIMAKLGLVDGVATTPASIFVSAPK